MAYDITVNAAQAKQELNSLRSAIDQTLAAAYGILSLMRRVGLGDEFDAAISKVLRLIAVINILKTSITLMWAALFPVGGAAVSASQVAIAGVAVAGSALSAGVMMYELADETMGRQR